MLLPYFPTSTVTCHPFLSRGSFTGLLISQARQGSVSVLSYSVSYFPSVTTVNHFSSFLTLLRNPLVTTMSMRLEVMQYFLQRCACYWLVSTTAFFLTRMSRAVQCWAITMCSPCLTTFSGRSNKLRHCKHQVVNVWSQKVSCEAMLWNQFNRLHHDTSAGDIFLLAMKLTIVRGIVLLAHHQFNQPS